MKIGKGSCVLEDGRDVSPHHSSLYDILDIIPKTGRLKHFIISPETHNILFNNIKGVPKVVGNLSINIALRRTDADWVAVTTIDNIPPLKEELLNLINKSNNNTQRAMREIILYSGVIQC